MIALPWLVLTLTGIALAVGTVFAMAGIPRALFMLLGGVLTDRFKPCTLMIGSKLAGMILTGLLATLAIPNLIQLWRLYTFALDSLSFLASMTILGMMRIENAHAHTEKVEN